jgi:dTDP-4-amino-4,6-dideoxygalactose transaminase
MMKSKLAILGGEKAVKSAYKFEWPVITSEIERAVIKQLHEKISIYGREGIYIEVEEKFAHYHGMKYVISTNSGTSALHSAFFGVGIGPGDEVICPTYTFLATVTPILQCNGIPVLCDAQIDTGNIDPKEILSRITNRTKAIVITHVWGHPCEMDEIVKIAHDNGLYLIEDCSHAHGATYKGKKVGTFGDVSAWSLQAKKVITAGEGGILLTNNQTIFERATLLGHFRVRSEQTVESEHYRQYSSTGFGLNYRMHPIGAAIANVEIDHLSERIAGRKHNLDLLSNLLADIPGITPPITRPYVTRGAYYGYKPLYQTEELKNLPVNVYVDALRAEGVDIHMPGSRPLHLLPLFQSLTDEMYVNGWPRKGPQVSNTYIYKRGDFPNSEFYYSHALSMPTFTEVNDEITQTIEQYADAFRKVARNLDNLIKYAANHEQI